MRFVLVIWLACSVTFVLGWWAGSRTTKNRVLLWLAEPPATGAETGLSPRPEGAERARPRRAPSRRAEEAFVRPRAVVSEDPTGVEKARPTRPRA